MMYYLKMLVVFLMLIVAVPVCLIAAVVARCSGSFQSFGIEKARAAKTKYQFLLNFKIYVVNELGAGVLKRGNLKNVERHIETLHSFIKFMASIFDFEYQSLPVYTEGKYYNRVLDSYEKRYGGSEGSLAYKYIKKLRGIYDNA